MTSLTLYRELPDSLINFLGGFHSQEDVGRAGRGSLTVL